MWDILGFWRGRSANILFFGSVDLPILVDACQGNPDLVPVVSMLGITRIGYGARRFREFAKSMTTEDGLAYAVGRDVQILRKPGHLITATLSAREKPLAVESAIVGEVVQLTDVVSKLLKHDASLANPGLQLTEMFIKASQSYK